MHRLHKALHARQHVVMHPYCTFAGSGHMQSSTSVVFCCRASTCYCHQSPVDSCALQAVSSITAADTFLLHMRAGGLQPELHAAGGARGRQGGGTPRHGRGALAGLPGQPLRAHPAAARVAGQAHRRAGRHLRALGGLRNGAERCHSYPNVLGHNISSITIIIITIIVRNCITTVIIMPLLSAPALVLGNRLHTGVSKCHALAACYACVLLCKRMHKDVLSVVHLLQCFTGVFSPAACRFHQRRQLRCEHHPPGAAAPRAVHGAFRAVAVPCARPVGRQGNSFLPRVSALTGRGIAAAHDGLCVQR